MHTKHNGIKYFQRTYHYFCTPKFPMKYSIWNSFIFETVFFFSWKQGFQNNWYFSWYQMGLAWKGLVKGPCFHKLKIVKHCCKYEWTLVWKYENLRKKMLKNKNTAIFVLVSHFHPIALFKNTHLPLLSRASQVLFSKHLSFFSPEDDAKCIF